MTCLTSDEPVYFITESKLQKLRAAALFHESIEGGIHEFVEDIRSHPYNIDAITDHAIKPGRSIFMSTDGWVVCRVGQGTECDLFKDGVYLCTTPDESVAFKIKSAMRAYSQDGG